MQLELDLVDVNYFETGDQTEFDFEAAGVDDLELVPTGPQDTPRVPRSLSSRTPR